MDTEVTRAAFSGPWRRWTPDPSGARKLDPDEPAQDYAFKAGDHADAMRRDRADERHKTEWRLRLRPLAERGSVDGTTPFAPLLAGAARAA